MVIVLVVFFKPSDAGGPSRVVCNVTWVRITEQTDWREKHTPDLRLPISEALRSLRHYHRAQNQEHHTIDRLEERGMARGSAGGSTFNGQERAIVNRTNIGLFFFFLRQIGVTSERRGGTHMGFSERIDTVLN